MTRSLVALMGVSCALGAAACSSSDDTRRVAVVDAAGSEAVDSGAGGSSSPMPRPPGGAYAGGHGAVPDSTEILSGLSAAEAVALCNASADAAEAAFGEEEGLRFSCFLTATAFSGREDGSIDVTLCEQTFDSCLMDAELTGSRSERNCDEQDLLTQFQDCSATVADFNDCMAQQLSALTLLLDSLTCNDHASAPDASSPTPPDSAACTSLMAQCPHLELAGSSGGGLEPSATGCDDTCAFADDGTCDDGGSGSSYALCGLGTDCSDCGRREP